jgi:hypothetical protein
MRWRLPVIGLLVACKGAADTDTSGDTDDTAADEGHPLVPDEYQYVWDIDGCTNSQGQEGANVYILGEATADEDGVLAGSESWTWFFPEEGWDDDCIDTFDVTGTIAGGFGIFQCPECEEKYDVVREPDSESCSLRYNDLFGLEEEPDPVAYASLQMFDFEDDGGVEMPVMLVYVSHADVDGNYAPETEDWGTGSIEPEGSDVGHPATFAWMHDLCVVVTEE